MMIHSEQLGTIKGATTLLQNKDLFDLVEPVLDSGADSLEKAISTDGGRSVQLLMRSNNLGGSLIFYQMTLL